MPETMQFTADGLAIADTLHLPADLRPGGRRPATADADHFMFSNPASGEARLIADWLARYFPVAAGAPA